MIRKLFSDSVVSKNILILLTGTIAAQLIPFLVSPLLSRLYLPDDFGYYSIITSAVGTLSVVICTRYEQAIILPKEDKDAASLISGSLKIAAIISTLSLVAILVYKNGICDLLKITSGKNGLFVIPFLLLFIGIQQCFNYWLIRKKSFKQNSLNKVIQTSSIAIIGLGLGFLGVSSGLIIAYLLGWALLALFSFYQARKAGFNLIGVTQSDSKRNLIKYKDFPIFNSVPALFNSFASTLPVFYVSNLYTPEITGFYAQSRLMILVPISLISVSIAQVYFERIASKVREGESIIQELKQVALVLFSAAVVLVLIVRLLAPFLFSVILGDIWVTSGIYSQVLVYSFAIQFVISPLSNVLTALNRIKLASIWPILYLLLMLTLSLFEKPKDVIDYLKVLTVLEFLSYFIYGLIILYAVNSYEKKRILSV